MSGAGVRISALSRCRRLLWSSCGRPMSALSRAAPTRPLAGASLLTAALLPCKLSAVQVKRTPSCCLCLQRSFAAYVMACFGIAHHTCSDLTMSRMKTLLLQEGAGRAAAQVPFGAAGVSGAQPARAAPGHAGARRAARCALPAVTCCSVSAGTGRPVRRPACLTHITVQHLPTQAC